ncbi:MAG: type II toxin-antitoxin system HipA family toxin [Dongiaceae bacterium]
MRDKVGHLLIAKFPRKDDEWPVTRWEAATMALAEAAGVEVSPWRLQHVLKKPVLMARRFDRREGQRIPYMSALTALDASDNETRSYLEIAEFLRREGSQVNEDLRQLWRRIVFNMLVSNTDDHLRNHGFLRDPNGWRLAPAYDLNPMPTDVKPRIHALAIDEIDGTASFDTALQIAPMFGMVEKDAHAIATEVGSAVAGWRDVAARFGITSDKVERMASAFDHEDLKAATRGRT